MAFEERGDMEEQKEKGEVRIVVVSPRKVLLAGIDTILLAAGVALGGLALFKSSGSPAQAQGQPRIEGFNTAQIGPYWVFSEGCTYPGFQEWLTILNINDERVDVSVDMFGPDGYIGTAIVPMDAFSRTSVNINAAARYFGHVGDVSLLVNAKFYGTSTDAPILCERPMYFNFGGFNGGTTSTGYNGE